LEWDGNIFSSAFQSRLDVQFCVDVTEHMDGTSVNLQGANRYVNVMRHNSSVPGEASNMGMQLQGSNATHFPTLTTQRLTDAKKYVVQLPSSTLM
jgi:hypothetical protein